MSTDNSTPSQPCSKCKQSFVLTAEFWHKDKSRKSGFVSICKTCACKKSRDYGQENKEDVLQKHKNYYAETKDTIRKDYIERNAERIAAGKRAYRKSHPEQTKKNKSDSQKRHRPAANLRVKRFIERHPEYQKQQYQKNKHIIIVRAAKYAKDHPEIVNASSRKSYQLHKDEKLAKQKEYNRTHPEVAKATRKRSKDKHKDKIRLYNAEYDRAHPERARAKSARRRARIVTNGGNFTRYDILRIFEEQEHRCLYCGITLYLNIPNDMHIDHIKPLSKGGTNAPDNLACACADCNLSKGSKTLSDWQLTRGW